LESTSTKWNIAWVRKDSVSHVWGDRGRVEISVRSERTVGAWLEQAWVGFYCFAKREGEYEKNKKNRNNGLLLFV
jgi:hypothetical protein